MMKLGPLLMRSAISAANSHFMGRRAKALFAGNSAHSIMPLHRPFTAAFGVMLGMLGHGVGWPIARGGAQSIADALVSVLITRGGEIRTNTRIDSLDQLPEAELIFLDMAPRRIAEIEGLDFPASYLDNLRTHAQGPGVFKIDWALDNPIPWKDHNCLSAASVHLGGPIEEVVESEAKAWEQEPSERPFVLLSQPTLFDRDRAPEGKHIGWAYCHVPNGCEMDMTDRIENRIEEFAPGFKNRIIARHVMFPGDMEAHNPNYVGGDIAGGVQGFRELFLKPLGRWRAYETPLKGVYICSSSMPPGAGVHGICGHLAAAMALKSLPAG
jgi:phytoene dehydrogenase-like protein